MALASERSRHRRRRRHHPHKLAVPGVWALVIFRDAAVTACGPIEITLEGEDPIGTTTPFLADAHELRRFVIISLALAVALAVGEAGRNYLITGDIWTTWGLLPLGVVFLLFPTSFTVTTIWHTYRSMGVLRGEEPLRIATFANRPLDVRARQLAERDDPDPDLSRELRGRDPSDARRRTRSGPSLSRADRCALQRGGLRRRLALLRQERPRGRSPTRGVSRPRNAAPTRSSCSRAWPTTTRTTSPSSRVPFPSPAFPARSAPVGFRKASNLNYTLRLADRLEGGAPVSEAHAHFQDAVPEHVYELGRWQGDVRVGEFIVQLDKDSVIPPDVIRVTVPEFLADPTLAYTQHASYPTNEDRYFSVVIGWFTRLLYDLGIRAKALIPGSFTPLMGHNILLRRADLFRVGAWYEHSVCEDLELALRLHESGSHGKFIAYPGHDFGEAVTRVYTEELEKFRRYAFGAAEAILNPISEWETRGVVKKSWRRFCNSEHVRWYQILDLVQFFFSLINLASLVPASIGDRARDPASVSRSATRSCR